MFFKRKYTKKINIGPNEACQLIQTHKNDHDFVLLDVRTPDEFAEFHIANAKNIDFYAPYFKEEL